MDLTLPPLHVGDIVTNPHRGERGHVIYADGDPNNERTLWDRGNEPLEGYPYVISLSPGRTVTTTNIPSPETGWWEIVPEDERTAFERVVHHQLTWTQPEQLDDEQPVADSDTYDWHYLLALTPDRGYARSLLEDDSVDWPDTFTLERIVARRIDEMGRLNLRTWQYEVAMFVATHFADRSSPEHRIAKHIEEFGELAGEIVRLGEGRGDLDRAVAELGDAFITLVAVATSVEIDVADAIARRWAVVRQRDDGFRSDTEDDAPLG